jgi:hypothetical protein
VGKLKRWIPAASGSDIHFPVGTGTTRRLATIHYTAPPSGGTLTAEFVLASPGTSGLPLTEYNNGQEEFIVNKTGTSGYWTITAGTLGEETLTGGIYKATLEATNFAGLSNLENFVLLKRGNITQPWNLSGTHITATGSLTSPVISRTGLIGFSDFTLGGSENLTLPVTLTALKAVAQGNNALITWKTTLELNNQGFQVEVSADGRHYRGLGFVPAKEANFQTERNYAFTDTENGKFGDRYYRLKQVDVDGKTFYYGPKVVNFKEEPMLLTANPNPFSQNLEISIGTTANQVGNISLKDMQGREIWVTQKALLRGNNKIALAIPANLAKGIYFLQVRLNQTNKSIRLIKE